MVLLGKDAWVGRGLQAPALVGRALGDGTRLQKHSLFCRPQAWILGI